MFAYGLYVFVYSVCIFVSSDCVSLHCRILSIYILSGVIEFMYANCSFIYSSNFKLVSVYTTCMYVCVYMTTYVSAINSKYCGIFVNVNVYCKLRIFMYYIQKKLKLLRKTCIRTFRGIFHFPRNEHTIQRRSRETSVSIFMNKLVKMLALSSIHNTKIQCKFKCMP